MEGFFSFRSEARKLQRHHGYGWGVPPGVPFHGLLESYFLWILAEKSTVTGPPGGGFSSTPGTYLNSTLGFALNLSKQISLGGW